MCTTCLLRWFPSASECDKKVFINKLLHWTTMCLFPGANFFFPRKRCEILILDVIVVLNCFTGCEKAICRYQKHISTIFRSKVMALCLTVTAILNVVIYYWQTHKVKFTGRLVARVGFKRQFKKVHLSPIFLDQNNNFTGLFAEIYLERVPQQNFGETTSCVKIIVLIKLKCLCLLMVDL